MENEIALETVENKIQEMETRLEEGVYPEINNSFIEEQVEEIKNDLVRSENINPIDIPGHSMRRRILKSQGLLRVKNSEWFKRINYTTKLGKELHEAKTEEMHKIMKQEEDVFLDKRKDFLISVYGEERGIEEYKKELKRRDARVEKKLKKK